MFTPTPNRSLSSTSETKDYNILKILEDVKTNLEFWQYADKCWTKQGGDDTNDGGAIPVGQDVSVGSHCRDSSADNKLWLWRDGYLDLLFRSQRLDGGS